MQTQIPDAPIHIPLQPSRVTKPYIARLLTYSFDLEDAVKEKNESGVRQHQRAIVDTAAQMRPYLIADCCTQNIFLNNQFLENLNPPLRIYGWYDPAPQGTNIFDHMILYAISCTPEGKALSTPDSLRVIAGNKAQGLIMIEGTSSAGPAFLYMGGKQEPLENIMFGDTSNQLLMRSQSGMDSVIVQGWLKQILDASQLRELDNLVRGVKTSTAWGLGDGRTR